MTLLRTVAAASAVGVAALGPAATAASTQVTPRNGARPHSRIVTYARGDLRVLRLQLALSRSGRVLRGRVRLTVRNELPRAVRRELRVGRCTHGPPARPTCPTTAVIHVDLPPRALRSYVASVTLRQPPARPDAVQAALVRRGAPQPFTFRSDALLLLTGRAWRGASAGRTYGVRFAGGDAARRLSFDIPVTGPDVAYIDVHWQGAAAPRGAETRIARCRASSCLDTTLTASRSRSSPEVFGDRFDFTRAGADRLGLRAVTGEATLFDAALPWPA